jgi:hypothetical protein
MDNVQNCDSYDSYRNSLIEPNSYPVWVLVFERSECGKKCYENEVYWYENT